MAVLMFRFWVGRAWIPGEWQLSGLSLWVKVGLPSGGGGQKLKGSIMENYLQVKDFEN
jgi:hypothetical protein